MYFLAFMREEDKAWHLFWTSRSKIKAFFRRSCHQKCMLNTLLVYATPLTIPRGHSIKKNHSDSPHDGDSCWFSIETKRDNLSVDSMLNYLCGDRIDFSIPSQWWNRCLGLTKVLAATCTMNDIRNDWVTVHTGTCIGTVDSTKLKRIKKSRWSNCCWDSLWQQSHKVID